ncbi:hypothetical protein JZ751_016408 [Albula glossodonta]|uniref:Uncharacterized protein n=1 Tax=Albula glossodonta TaxID=121402 RepID=A0A8T2NS60_9TELE|nr:hypothetical protein JZ751_016408 [Albula glossodonta]
MPMHPRSARHGTFIQVKRTNRQVGRLKGRCTDRKRRVSIRWLMAVVEPLANMSAVSLCRFSPQHPLRPRMLQSGRRRDQCPVQTHLCCLRSLLISSLDVFLLPPSGGATVTGTVESLSPQGATETRGGPLHCGRGTVTKGQSGTTLLQCGGPARTRPSVDCQSATNTVLSAIPPHQLHLGDVFQLALGKKCLTDSKTGLARREIPACPAAVGGRDTLSIPDQRFTAVILKHQSQRASSLIFITEHVQSLKESSPLADDPLQSHDTHSPMGVQMHSALLHFPY